MVRSMLVARLRSICRPPALAQEPEIPVHKLTVTPAAAPVPALRYELLPELTGHHAGQRRPALLPGIFAGVVGRPSRGDRRWRKRSTRPDKPGGTKEQDCPDIGFVRNSAHAQRGRPGCPAGLLRLGNDARGCGRKASPCSSRTCSAPRSIARCLKVRTELELADSGFDQATYTLQTGLQLGRDIAHAPTLIQALVGAAITAVMLKRSRSGSARRIRRTCTGR